MNTELSAQAVRQSIPLKNVRNARQLGGYAAEDGRRVKPGRLLRTALLANADAADIATLTQEYSLKNVVDMRSASERAHQPDPVIPGVTNEHIDIMADTNAPVPDAKLMRRMREDMAGLMLEMVEKDVFGIHAYRDMLRSRSACAGYKRFFEILLNTESGATLWHCTSGKDRTGIGAVLLLLTLGVDRQTALEDFMLTNEFNAADINMFDRKLRERGAGDDIILRSRTMSGVRRESMENMLGGIDEDFGSFDGFVHEVLGLSAGDVARLKDMYME